MDPVSDRAITPYQGGDVPPESPVRGNHEYAIYLLKELGDVLRGMPFEPEPGGRVGNLLGVSEHNLEVVERLVRNHQVIEVRRAYSRTEVSFVVSSSGECRSAT